MHHPFRRASAAFLAAAVIAGVACTGDDDDGGSADGGEIVGTGDTYEATIRRTEGGVPHITGDSMADVAFGQGWASGEDRACDLADQVLKVTRRAGAVASGRARTTPTSTPTCLAGDRHRRAGRGRLGRVARRRRRARHRVRRRVERPPRRGRRRRPGRLVRRRARGCARSSRSRSTPTPGPIALQASSGALDRYIASASPAAAAAEADEAPAVARPVVRPPPVARDAEPPPRRSCRRRRSRRTGGPSAPTGRRTAAACSSPTRTSRGRASCGSGRSTSPSPAKLDVYGVQLSGLPGIGIGFTEEFGWTHTVSAGNRFTAYRLDLVPGSPTTYLYGDETRDMTPTDAHRRGAGRRRRGQRGDPHHVGQPLRPGDRLPRLRLDRRGHHHLPRRQHRQRRVPRAVPGACCRPTTSTSSSRSTRRSTASRCSTRSPRPTTGGPGTPTRRPPPTCPTRRSPPTRRRSPTDPIVAIAADNGAVLLDGSDPMYEWVEEEGARDPGLVPAAEQPQVERATTCSTPTTRSGCRTPPSTLEGDYSPLHGRQDTARSPRTRENAVVLDDTIGGRAVRRGRRVHARRAGRRRPCRTGATRRGRCSTTWSRAARPWGRPPSPSRPRTSEPGRLPSTTPRPPALPAASIDVAPACAVLAAWDGVYDLDRAGPPLWRELMARYGSDAMTEAGTLWAEPFDPTQPDRDAGGLARGARRRSDGRPGRQNLARAVQVLEVGRASASTSRSATCSSPCATASAVPIHGGNSFDGTTNVVGFGERVVSPRPRARPRRRASASLPDRRWPASTTRRATSSTTARRSSWRWPSPTTGPRPRTFLDLRRHRGPRRARVHRAATQAFSDKEWRDVPFTEDEVEEATTEVVTVRG